MPQIKKEEKKEEVELNVFLEELISVMNERFKKHESAIAGLKREVSGLKSSSKQRKLKVDKSVLKILKG